MKEFEANIAIRSKSLSLYEISCLLKIQFHPLSCEKGESTSEGRVRDATIGIIHPIVKGSDLNKIMDDIISSTQGHVFLQSEKINDIELVLDVQVLYDTYTCSLSILPSHAAFFAKNNIRMEFSFYPTSCS